MRNLFGSIGAQREGRKKLASRSKEDVSSDVEEKANADSATLTGALLYVAAAGSLLNRTEWHVTKCIEECGYGRLYRKLFERRADVDLLFQFSSQPFSFRRSLLAKLLLENCSSPVVRSSILSNPLIYLLWGIRFCIHPVWTLESVSL